MKLLTLEEHKSFKNAKNCHICGEAFQTLQMEENFYEYEEYDFSNIKIDEEAKNIEDNRDTNIKIKDHCHLTGKIILRVYK